MINYRGNEADYASKRVHSMVKLDKNEYRFMPSTFNNLDDTTLTLMMSESNDSIKIFDLEVFGPRIKLLAETLDKSEVVDLVWNVNYPKKVGENGTIIEIPSQVIFKKQKADLSINLIRPTKRAHMDGSLVDMDRYFTFSGAYRSSMAIDDISISDRLSPSRQFIKVAGLFEDSIIHGDLVYGVQKNDEGKRYARLLANDNKEKFKTELNDTTIVSLGLAHASNSSIDFFSYERRETMPDILRMVYTLDCGSTWNSIIGNAKTQSLQKTRIIGTDGVNFFFSGYDNSRGYSIQVTPFFVEDSMLKFNNDIVWEQFFEDKIAEFDVVSVNKTDFVVVAGVEYETKAQFFWLSIIDEFREKPRPKIQILSGMSKVALVPNVTEAHQGVVFKCAMTTNSTTEMKCVNSVKNLHSYVVKYTLDLRSSTYDFVTSSKVEAVLYNVVNLQPTAVLFERDFVAFRAKNQLPLKADEEIQHNKFFRDSHVFLVYKLNKYIVKYGNPDQVYTADVYKIFEAADFEAETGADLSKVRPRFFTDSAGQIKLTFNLGKKSHSLHIYNLDGITMSLTESQAGKMDYRFSAKGLSGKEYEFRASQIFN